MVVALVIKCRGWASTLGAHENETGKNREQKERCGWLDGTDALFSLGLLFGLVGSEESRGEADE